MPVKCSITIARNYFGSLRRLYSGRINLVSLGIFGILGVSVIYGYRRYYINPLHATRGHGM